MPTTKAESTGAHQENVRDVDGVASQKATGKKEIVRKPIHRIHRPWITGEPPDLPEPSAPVSLERKHTASCGSLSDLTHRNPLTFPHTPGGSLPVCCTFSPSLRQYVAEALGKVGVANPEVVSELLKALLDQDSDVRQYAAEALWQVVQRGEEGL